MKHLILLFVVLLSQSVASEKCLRHYGQVYCQVFSSERKGVQTFEFLLRKESLESWTKMITIKKYKNKHFLKDVLPDYMNSVRSMFALKPELFSNPQSKYKENMMILLTLLAPDKSHYEYVVNHFYNSGDGPITSIFYSHRLPFAEKIDFTEVMKKNQFWMLSLAKIDVDGVLKIDVAKGGD